MRRRGGGQTRSKWENGSDQTKASSAQTRCKPEDRERNSDSHTVDEWWAMAEKLKVEEGRRKRDGERRREKAATMVDKRVQ